MDVKDAYPNSFRYQPYRNEDLKCIETESSYIERIRKNLLPNWPRELIKEWLFRHAVDIEKYTFLEFRNLVFEKRTWNINEMPGKEVYHDPMFFENFKNIKIRAELDPNDWLAHYMIENGTWNTSIVLLKNFQDKIHFPHGESLRSPYHLLEGHRRLAFLNGLKELNSASEYHDIWISLQKK